jgi:hypothetical protein
MEIESRMFSFFNSIIIPSRISSQIPYQTDWPGEETSYKARIKPKEEGFSTVYGNVYENHRRIDTDYIIDRVPSGKKILQ